MLWLIFFHAGSGHGPCFQTRPGAPAEADLKQALDLLSARRAHLEESEKHALQRTDENTAATPSAASRELIEFTPLVQSDPEASWFRLFSESNIVKSASATHQLVVPNVH